MKRQVTHINLVGGGGNATTPSRKRKKTTKAKKSSRKDYKASGSRGRAKARR